MSRTKWSLVLLLAIGVGPSCGQRDAGDPEPNLVVPVQVENDLTQRSDVSVRLIGSTGYTALLGGAPPGGSRLFEYRERLLSGTYRLRASTGDGRIVESRPFTLFPGSGVLWELERNVLQVVSAEILYDPGR